MPLSPYYANIGLNYLLRNTGAASASTLYVGLFTGDPEVNTTTELVASGYARQTVTFVAPLAGATRNTADVNFGTLSVDWSTVLYYGIFDALTTGNLLASEAFEESFTALTGDTVTLAAGTLNVTLE